MKKVLAILVCLLVFGSAAWAVDFGPAPLQLSAGGGLYFQYAMTSVEMSGYGQSRDMDFWNALGVGGYVMFDATYIELDAAIGYYSLGLDDEAKTMMGSSALDEITGAMLDLGALLKYPIGITDGIKLFPLFGIGYQIGLSISEDLDPYDAGDMLNALWIRFGLGGDFDISKNLYVRANILYGIKMNSKIEDDADDYDVEFFTHGPRFQLGLGYRF